MSGDARKTRPRHYRSSTPSPEHYLFLTNARPMWHGRANARPSTKPTKACGHMRDDWHGAVAIPMTASCASSTATDAAPLCFACFSEVASGKSTVLWALGRVIELHARRTARLTHAQHHAPRCRR